MGRSRARAEKHGHFAELVAVMYMRLKGYRLLAQRFKSPQGEVDLIMRRRDVTENALTIPPHMPTQCTPPNRPIMKTEKRCNSVTWQ